MTFQVGLGSSFTAAGSCVPGLSRVIHFSPELSYLKDFQVSSTPRSPTFPCHPNLSSLSLGRRTQQLPCSLMPPPLSTILVNWELSVTHSSIPLVVISDGTTEFVGLVCVSQFGSPSKVRRRSLCSKHFPFALATVVVIETTLR